MANCVISDPPVYTDEISKWDKQTNADGDAMGAVIEKLLNNTAYNKYRADRAGQYWEITLEADAWEGEAAPYTQTVPVEGMIDQDRPTPFWIDDGADEDDSKARQKAYGYISYFDSGAGSVTATCKYQKPESDCKVGLKGV